MKEKGKDLMEKISKSSNPNFKLFGIVSLTGSTANFAELKDTLSEELIKAIEKNIEIETATSSIELDEATKKETIEALISEKLKNERYQFEIDEEGDVYIKQAVVQKEAKRWKIDYSGIDEEKVASFSKAILKRHQDFGKFSDNEYLNGREVEIMISKGIECAKAVEKQCAKMKGKGEFDR